MKRGKRDVNHTLALVFLGIFAGFLIGFYSRDFLVPPAPIPISRFIRPFASVKRRLLARKETPHAAMQTPQPKTSPSPAATPGKSPAPSPSASPSAPAPPPRVAFIIDDMGNNLPIAAAFVNSPFPVALSVLPNLQYSEAVADETTKAGKPLMLHLPLEAEKDNQLLGPGALFTNMDDKTLQGLIEQDLKTVPGAEGINNHMGSKGSSDPRIARAVVMEAKSHHLFVIDSFTSPASVLYQEAQKAGVPSARREVFLDDTVSEPYIKSQFLDLIRIARKKGTAIAIGHPHPETLKVLMEMIPVAEKEGIKVVPVTELVNAGR